MLKCEMLLTGSSTSTAKLWVGGGEESVIQGGGILPKLDVRRCSTLDITTKTSTMSFFRGSNPVGAPKSTPGE